MVFLALVIQTNAQETIPLNSFHSFSVKGEINFSYSWWFEDESGTRMYFTSKINSTEEYSWTTEGNYMLYVQATDDNGCQSEVISKPFVVKKTETEELAGADTVIGSCKPYTLHAADLGEGYHYSWEPAALLDNAESRTPVYIPGSSQLFWLTITGDDGFEAVDSVMIDVAPLAAEAGDQVFMYSNTEAALDGSASIGTGLQYHWTTQNGIIESGENTMHPIVGGFGTYVLEVTDKFGCMNSDSVNVGLLTYAPVAENDYDSTRYQTTVKIDVLRNDYDPENDIDSMSLSVKAPPFNGTATIDYNDFTISYRPDEGFTGTDNFEYEICDKTKNCDAATVFVLVSGGEFFIPDAFSPNGDGINDYFEIVGIELYPRNSIEIFNRWGNMVYRTANYGISSTPVFWDGKPNTGIRVGNEDLPTGTYFYVLDLGNGEKRIVGSVYLDR